MEKRIRFLLLLLIMTFGFSGNTSAVLAAEVQPNIQQTTLKRGWVKEGKYTFYYSKNGKMYTGWKKIQNRVYYFRKKPVGDAPAGSRMTGFQKVGRYTYYFNKKGVMLTGWQSLNGEAYYFQKSGSLGALGRMNIGLKKIGKKYYYFKADGAASVGWTRIKGKLYYFSKSKKLQTRGSAYTGWKKIGKYKYYFSAKGLRYTNRWIANKYYVDKNGRMLTSCITPDGYTVNASGVRGKKASGWIKSGGQYYYYTSGKKATGWKQISGKYYYFNAAGVRQTGWITVSGAKYYLNKYRVTGWKTISGKRYYFYNDGKMAVNTVIDRIVIGPDGVASEKKDGISILLIAGHGQGDPGACATYGKTTYYESNFTREFATLIYNRLRAVGGGMTVTMYDQNYDCYRQAANTLGSSGLKLSFTGSGAKKNKVLAGIRTNPNLPDFTQYDYVLEIHFNATGTANKDLKGDGKYKGIGMYVNKFKKDYAIDSKIVSNVVNKTGFKMWGGILASSGLFNAKTCQELGVSYGLLETAFIDDKDDMIFYNKNKDAMAQAVAEAIRDYFSK